MFHLLLRDLRRSKHLTQSDLAAVLGTSTSAVGNWELGLREPDFQMLQRIAEYFHVSTDYLLGRDVATEQPKPAVSDVEAAKVALFGGDGEVTDEMWEEALFAAQMIKERYRRKKDD